jgi:cytochrome b subunit of formate dehydrogenase
MSRCLVLGLSIVTFVLAVAGIAIWLTAAAPPQPGFDTLLATGLFVASVFAGVALACAVFCTIETMTRRLIS